jgi:hypothetical protein
MKSCLVIFICLGLAPFLYADNVCSRLTKLEQLKKHTYSNFVQVLGKPVYEEEQPVKKVPTKSWHHTMVFGRYPKDDPKSENVLIKIVLWEDGDHFIGSCFHKKDKTWESLGIKRFNKEIRF